MSENEIILLTDIQKYIYTFRGVQIMFDDDLAKIYEIETKRLNEQVKRNIDRFPPEFCFQLSEVDVENLKSQIATSRWGGRRKLPYVFTEQGVAMLSAVLKSKMAVKVSIQIINAFIAMRKFLFANAQVFQRIESLEVKQIHMDQKLDKVLSAFESKTIQPKQGIFYNGQIFDAWQFVSDLVRSAKQHIILIDNYVDDSVLTLFAKKNKNVAITIFTKNINKQLEQDVSKFNNQYPVLRLKALSISHDRFLIIDNKELYHFGASLKDLGKKWFAFSKMEFETMKMLEKLQL